MNSNQSVNGQSLFSNPNVKKWGVRAGGVGLLLAAAGGIYAASQQKSPADDAGFKKWTRDYTRDNQ